MRRARRNFVTALVLTSLVTAACSETAEHKTHDKSAVIGHGGLVRPPFPLTTGATLAKAGPSSVLVTARRRSAILDLGTGRWRSAATPPDLIYGAVGFAGDRVLLLGLKCNATCETDRPQPVFAAALDVRDPMRWKLRALDLEPRIPDDFSVASVGELADRAVFSVNRDVVTVGPDLASETLPNPSPYTWRLCVDDRRLTALIPTEQAAADPQSVVTPTIGNGGNARVVTYDAGAKAWSNAPGSESALIPGGPAEADAYLCASTGPLLATPHQTSRWDGRQWISATVDVPSGGLRAAGTLADGSSVAISGNVVAVFREDRWQTRAVEAAPSAPPLGIQIAALDHTVVALVPGKSVESAAVLRRVFLSP
jgi:hypothetical protein